MKTKFISILFVFLVFLFQSQNETSKWYFGGQVALDFLSNPISQPGNSNMSSVEASASVADASGNLLFYTNGENVWDASHSIMANGSGLLGNESASQGALIIKKPGSTHLYYIFTMDEWLGNNGLHYSVIDLSLAAGMGSVTVKNAFLLNTKPSEMICSVKHCNNNDVWIVVIESAASKFFSFLLTNSGFSSPPVTSNLTLPPVNSIIGQLKTSPDGSRLASSLTYSNNRTSVKLYDFNNQTGGVSGEKILDDTSFLSTTTNRYYGCEFSQDGTKLYASRFSGKITQWNLCSGNELLIKQSKTILSDQNYLNPRGMQLGVDSKIYITGYNQQSLGTINDPNLSGQACNYMSNGLSVNTGTLYNGLPNFPSYYFFKKTPQPFTNTLTCRTVNFSPASSSCAATASVQGYLWDFGDLQNPQQNTSTLQSPMHNYAVPGTYSVTLARQFPCYSDTVVQTINVSGTTPTLSITGLGSFCVNDTRTLSVSGASSYSWSSGETQNQVVVSPTLTGVYLYTVSGTNALNCSATKTLSFIVSKCVGLEENDLNQVKIFPNPFSSSLKIESEKEIQIKIYNQLGDLIFMQEAIIGEREINLQQLPSGLYHLKIIDKQGKATYKKIVKAE